MVFFEHVLYDAQWQLYLTQYFFPTIVWLKYMFKDKAPLSSENKNNLVT